MARRWRIQFAGARYHVINRGNLQHDVFATGGAIGSFVRTLPAATERFRWRSARLCGDAQSLPPGLGDALKAPPSDKPLGEVDEPAKTGPLYLAASSLRVPCGLSYIATEADLDTWLAALRKAAQAELKKRNRISL